MSRVTVVFLCSLLSLSARAQNEVLILNETNRPKEIVFEKSHDKLLVAFRTDKGILRHVMIDTAGLLLQPETEMPAKGTLAGIVLRSETRVFYFIENVSGKSFTIKSSDGNSTNDKSYSFEGKLLTSFTRDTKFVVLTWSENNHLVISELDETGVCYGAGFSIKKDLATFFRDPSAIRFIDENSAYDIYAGLAETKIYVRGGSMLILMDNIYSGTTVAEIDLEQKSVAYRNYPVVNGEIGGLTNTSLNSSEVLRATLSENEISLVKIDLASGQPSPVEKLNLPAVAGLYVYKVKGDGSIVRSPKKKSKFFISRQTQRLAMIGYEKDTVAHIQVGLYDKERTGDIFIPGGLGVAGFVIGGLVSAALQSQGNLDYFYLTSGKNSLYVPEKTPFQKVDDYEVWVRKLGITPKLRSRVMVGNKLFFTYWDGNNEKIRVVRFYLD